MWWPLFELEGRAARIDTGRFRYEPVTADIESLNHRSGQGELEITAISCAQYPYIKDRYALTACGASLGDAYGPKIVSREPMEIDDLKSFDVVLAVPGTRTSAFAATCLLLGKDSFRYEVVPFEQIIARVGSGEFRAGLIIHEGQLTFEQSDLRLVVDLGAWWTQRTGLPLPLGANAIRRDLDARYGDGSIVQVTATLRRSVEYALEHRREAVGYALQFARDMSAELADEFIGMYVNKMTLDFGQRGQAAVREFLRQVHEAGLAPSAGPIDFVGPRVDGRAVEPVAR